MDSMVNTRKKPLFARQTSVFAWAVIALPLAFYLVFWLFPNLLSVFYSFFSWDGLTEPVFIGFSNYLKVFTDPFLYRALLHNVVLLIFVPVLTVGIALLLANGLANNRFLENKFLQTVYFIPNVLASVVVSMLWSFMYNGSFGILNSILNALGFDFKDFYWLASKKTALWSLIPVYVWSNVGYQVIIYYNAMKSIPSSLYESADIEGATAFHKFHLITIPLLKGILKTTVLFLVLMTFKSYDIVLILTGGGPAGATDVTGLYMFSMAFGIKSGVGMMGRNYGYASTIGMVLFIVLVAFNLILNRIKDESIEY